MAASRVNEQPETSQTELEKDKELGALSDFDEPKKPQETIKTSPEVDPAKMDDPFSDAFSEQFSKELANKFEDAMRSFMKDDPDLLQQFEKLSKAAGTAGESEVGTKEFDNTSKETLDSLAKNTKNLQDDGISGMKELATQIFGFGLDDSGLDGAYMPIMQTMMKELMSKEVLYPSMQEMSEKYPGWLLKNKTKLNENEYTNYEKQYKIIKEMLAEFDKELPTDTEDTKKQCYDKIINLMQKMLDLGQPPKDFVVDQAPDLDFDQYGIPKFPSSPESCCVM